MNIPINTENQINKKVNKPPIGLSLIVLIIVNLVPVFGVLFLNWSPMEIVYLYWAETAVIGLFNVLRMAVSAKNTGVAAVMEKLFMIPFFIVHFGGFILGQGVFIMAMDPSFQVTENTEGVHFDLNSNNQFFIDLLKIIWPVLLLTGSHLFSFFFNYIGKKEYKKYAASDLMMKPYGRIFVQQFLAIFGTMIVISMQNGRIVVMLLLVAAKIIADAYAHYREHRVKKEDETASV
jgi:hypothetical protein